MRIGEESVFCIDVAYKGFRPKIVAYIPKTETSVSFATGGISQVVIIQLKDIILIINTVSRYFEIGIIPIGKPRPIVPFFFSALYSSRDCEKVIIGFTQNIDFSAKRIDRRCF